VAGYHGRFRRSESRLSVFGIWERWAGSTAFEHNVTLGIVGFTPKPMAYGCDFTSAEGGLPARFELQEAREGVPGALMKRERRGQVTMDGATLALRSVHHLVGSPLELATPIGYVFEQDGLAIGAIELNGSPRLFLSPRADPATRRAIVTGAVALAVFWDPAESLLDDA
jgi:hypothetical protein